MLFYGSFVIVRLAKTCPSNSYRVTTKYITLEYCRNDIFFVPFNAKILWPFMILNYIDNIFFKITMLQILLIYLVKRFIIKMNANLPNAVYYHTCFYTTYLSSPHSGILVPVVRHFYVLPFSGVWNHYTKVTTTVVTNHFKILFVFNHFS